MATCNLKLYKCGLTKDRNAKIDDIAAFLENNNKAVIYKDNVQRIKHGMNILIKLDISQTEADLQWLDYCTIENTDSSKLYCYFINNIKPLAQRTIQLNLTLDTINTFMDEMEFTDRTYIEREHQDRFERFIKGIHSRDYMERRKIHRVSEGIVPLKYLKQKNKISSDEPDYFLVYKSDTNVTSESVGVISVTAYPSTPTTFSENTAEYITPTTATDRHTYALMFVNHPTAGSRTGYSESGDSITLEDSTHSVTYTIKTDGYEVNEYIYNQGSSAIKYVWQKTAWYIKEKTLQLGFTPTKITINAKIVYYNASRTMQDTDPTLYTQVDITSTNHEAKPIDELDRADSKLIKIIALPYKPFRTTNNNEVYTIPSGWFIDTNGVLTLKNPYTEFETPIYVFNFTELGYTRNHWGDSSAMRDDGLESKIYHSDFYERTLVYDSFARSIALERLKRSEAMGTPLESNLFKVTLYYKPTNSINSKFAFNFKFFEGEYTGFYWLSYDMNETFENYLMCERNNELSIFSNNYINYLRTGINYDIKAKNIATVQTLVGGAASVASNVSMAAISGNYAGAVIGTATGIVSTISSAISQQNAFEQKQTELKNQATGVAGSNDLDLLQYYSDNKAFDCVYQMTDQQKTNFLNLFYYCGYAIREMRKPVINSRYWFNFLQCTPQFVTPSANITNEYLADITARLKEGVTFYHNHNTTWDFDQIKENWETWAV